MGLHGEGTKRRKRVSRKRKKVGGVCRNTTKAVESKKTLTMRNYATG